MKYYAILLETIGSPEFTCKDENENPVLYTSEAAAWKEIADHKIMELQAIIDGDVDEEINESTFEIDEKPVEVTINGQYITPVEPELYQLIHKVKRGQKITID